MGMILGERISYFRKARGLTQEQLGQMVGVSSQAVSKWEKGGTPDVELLPAIADRLGVTIDGLFGRDAIQKEEMEKLLNQWLLALPAQERMGRLFRMLVSSHHALCSDAASWLNEVVNSHLDAGCYTNIPGENEDKHVWLRSLIRLEEGLVLSVPSNDFPLYLLLPEAPGGYAEHFAPNGTYRKLFSALSIEGSLEILLYLHGQKQNYFTAGSLSKHTGILPDKINLALQALEECNLVCKKQVELEEGAMDVWIVHDSSALVPFLYFARWIQEADSWLVCWETRKRPLLQKRQEDRLGKEAD